MTRTFDRARELFAAARDLPIGDRSAWLGRACGDRRTVLAEVRALLRENDDCNGSFLRSQCLPVDLLASASRARTGATRETIGGYRLSRVIGQGATSLVYHAQQRHPVRRPVALKVAKPGSDYAAVRARFEAEVDALAALGHPNVAVVLDAGASESGRPFYVTEYVPGEPITRFCERQRCTIAQRLELIMQACDALQHALERAVLHGDVRPAHLLVVPHAPSPLVKVIGFGAGAPSGQAHDARALGLVLAELVPDARGDLGCVLERATCDRGAQSYATPVDLKADLRRYLSHRPPLAGRRSPARAVRRLLRRSGVNLGGVVALLIAFALGFGAALLIVAG